MLNARTWHRLCLIAYAMFAFAFFSQFFPDNPILSVMHSVVLTGCLILGLGGAIFGILLIRGKLSLGCPTCDTRSPVSGLHRGLITLECPQCGHIMFRIGSLSKLQTITSEEERKERKRHRPIAKSPLHAPFVYRVPFLCLFLPVIASIVAASFIHHFSFFYLIIPGFWSYAVSGFVLESIYAGYFSMRHGGNISRQNAPIRFWGMIALWMAFYAFAAVFPIGYARQESRKEKAASEQISEPAP